MTKSRKNCPICEKRKRQRFCPARGERICAICCGTEREVSIDCPSDCPHLLAARRYEIEHRQPISPDEIPFPDLQIRSEVIHRNREVLSGLGLSILSFARENTPLRDGEILTALTALADTFRTLESGIYFERLPDAPLPRALYKQLAQFFEEFKKEEAQRTGFPQIRDSDIFRLIVFFLRIGRREANGRPRSRAFLDFLRAQFPRAPENRPETPRIIVP